MPDASSFHISNPRCFNPFTIETYAGGVGSEKYMPLVERLALTPYMKNIEAIVVGPDFEEGRYEKESMKLSINAPFDDGTSEFELPIKKISRKAPYNILDEDEFEKYSIVGIVGGYLFDNSLVDEVKRLAEAGKNVIIVGVDKDVAGNPLGPMGYLLPMSDFVYKSYEPCAYCREEGTLSNRTEDYFEPVCLKHKDFSEIPESSFKSTLEHYQTESLKNKINLGKLEVFSGNMRGGKTGKMIMHVYKIAKTKGYSHDDMLFLKPGADKREGEGIGGVVFRKGTITSRMGMAEKYITINAKIVDDKNPMSFLDDEEILDAEIIGIDETQFFSKDLACVIDVLRLNGTDVVCSSICTDFRYEPFGQTSLPDFKELPSISAISYIQCDANKVAKNYPICEHSGCTNRASRIQRFYGGRPASFSDNIFLPGENEYKVHCVPHHIVPGKPKIITRYKMDKWSSISKEER